MNLEGGCFCGSIRYRIKEDSYPAAICHCTMCRRTSAAAYVSWIVVPTTDFDYIQGEPEVLQSSSHGTRYFCGSCGTPVACVLAEHPDVIDVTICSLDDPGQYPPQSDVHTDTRLSWV